MMLVLKKKFFILIEMIASFIKLKTIQVKCKSQQPTSNLQSWNVFSADVLLKVIENFLGNIFHYVLYMSYSLLIPIALRCES